MTWRTGRADAINRLRETALVLTKLAKRKFLLQLFFLKEKLRNGFRNIIQKPNAMNRPPMRLTSLMDGGVTGGQPPAGPFSWHGSWRPRPEGGGERVLGIADETNKPDERRRRGAAKPMSAINPIKK